MGKTSGVAVCFVALSFLLNCCLISQAQADDDWSQLENALKNAGVISDPPAGTPPAPGGTQNTGQGQGTPSNSGNPSPSGPVWPTNPSGRPVPLPDGSFPHDTSNTQYGEYESEGGRLWREFRDGKLTSEQYQQKMNELRERLQREREERQRQEDEARAREAQERAKQYQEEGRARARARRERARERRRERKERERREREAREKKVSMGETGDSTGIFQVVDNVGAPGPGLGAPPDSRSMTSTEVASAPQVEHHHYHDE